MYKVICFGEALIDLLSDKCEGVEDTQERFTKYAGGAPANVSVALAKLGGRAYFCGMLGEDMFGRYLKQTLDMEGVNTEYVFFTDKAKTALAFVSLDSTGERRFEFYRPPAADLHFGSEHFAPEWFQSGGIFHFCSNSLTDPDIFAATQTGVNLAKSQQWVISFDVNLRLNLWNSLSNPRERIMALLPQSDVVKLAREELLYLANADDPEETVRRMLLAGNKLVLVTDGGNPLQWYSQNHSGTIVPENIQMVDATAAGDAFVGGVLYQLSQLTTFDNSFERWLVDPLKIERDLQFATSCGGFAAAHKGAFPSLPTLDAIQHFYRGNTGESS